MKRTEVVTVQWKTVPHIYNSTCKETFPYIDAAMIYVQFIWMNTSRLEEYVLNGKTLLNSSLIILNIIL